MTAQAPVKHTAYVPLAPGSDVAPVPRNEDSQGAPLVVVVDHDPIFLRLMKAIVQTAGYEATTINDGASAYEMISRDHPDLVVVDTWLCAREEGWDLLQLMRLGETTASIPIIVLSSDDQQRVEERFSEQDRDRVALLFKPFDVDVLLDAIDGMIQRVPVSRSFPAPTARPGHSALSIAE